MHNKFDTTFDMKELERYTVQLAGSLNNYWYDDGMDNDGDGRTDEETLNGIDDDGDGLVDEDTDFHPQDDTPGDNTENHQLANEWIDITLEAGK